MHDIHSAQAIQTVSQLTASIKFMLEQGFRFISVCGEISNLRTPFSGHHYFTLKDNTAQIRAVLLKPQARYLHSPLIDGQKIICRGRISVYEVRGEYQIVVDSVEEFGIGELFQKFLALKEKLSSAGIFDPSKKKPLPKYPNKIVLVTSTGGAAVHDFLKIWRQRHSPVAISIFPVTVQGKSAAAEIIKAIKVINSSNFSDIIVLCRGGGSLEDLWPFNDEHLAYAISGSQIPVVTGIGHEIDFTIADFAADYRAPTPTGAAECILPDTSLLQEKISQYNSILIKYVRHVLDKKDRELAHCSKQLSSIETNFLPHFLRLDSLFEKLSSSMNSFLQVKQHRVDIEREQIHTYAPELQLLLRQEKIRFFSTNLVRAITRLLEQAENTLKYQSSLLNTSNPLSSLSRGYAIVRKVKTVHGDNSIVRDADLVDEGERLEVILNKGNLIVTVDEKHRQKALMTQGE